VNHLTPNALVVWLDGKAGVLRQRMEQEQQSGKRRPSLTRGDPLPEIPGVLAVREPFYDRVAALLRFAGPPSFPAEAAPLPPE